VWKKLLLEDSCTFCASDGQTLSSICDVCQQTMQQKADNGPIRSVHGKICAELVDAVMQGAGSATDCLSFDL
jgi:hypothetical protein